MLSGYGLTLAASGDRAAAMDMWRAALAIFNELGASEASDVEAWLEEGGNCESNGVPAQKRFLTNRNPRRSVTFARQDCRAGTPKGFGYKATAQGERLLKSTEVGGYSNRA